MMLMFSHALNGEALKVQAPAFAGEYKEASSARAGGELPFKAWGFSPVETLPSLPR